MVDQRTMVELLREPTEGYAEAIVVPSVLAEQFELKYNLIKMMTSNQFFGLEKDNPHDHIRWRILFPNSSMNYSPSRTINLRNEISNFQQRFDESFHEAWDRYKDLLRACPHHGFTELHQLDTFYNALNPADQDSLKAAAGGNLLERRTQDVLTIIENKSKCLAAGGNTFPELRDNIQGYVSAAAVNNNQGNPGYRPPSPTQQNQNVHLNELEKVRRINEANMKAMQTQIDMVKNKLRNEMKNSIQTSLSNQTNEINNMMASLLQMNIAPTSGSRSLPSNTVANPKGELKAITTAVVLLLMDLPFPRLPQSINLEVDERVEETFMDPDLAEYTIKVPPSPVQKYKPPSQREYVVHPKDPFHPNIPYPSRMLKQKQQEKDEKLGLLELISTRMTLKLANRAICTPAGITRDVFVPVGKFTFPDDFVIIDYESDPRVPLILGRSFLRTARALIDIYGKERILRNGDERLILNMRHDTSTYSNQPQRESINVINVFNNSSEDLLKDLFTNQPSGSTTYSFSSNPLLEEFADELAFPPKYDDDLQFDIEFDLKEIEFLLYQDVDSSLKDSIDQSNLANLADNVVDSVLEMFTDEHALDYSSPLIFDEYDDDFLEIESDAENVYDDPFDSKGEKIKESKFLVDELDLPFDFLPLFEYDSFIS
nr:reverse transcriptase domain-containing protein [Tanacetum cinerariifolium]